MLWISVIAIACGLLSIGFILLEIDQALNTIAELKWYERINPIYLIKAFFPIVGDVSITLGLVWLFGMSGMVGMLVSMAGSALISGYLFFRRKSRAY